MEIQKLDLDCGYATVDWLPTQHGKRCGAKEIQTTVNQLVDAVNELHEEAKNNARIRADHEHKIEEFQAKDEEIAEWIAIVGDLREQVRELQARASILEEHAHPTATTEPAENVLTKSLRMEKEFAEEELERTKKELNDIEGKHEKLLKHIAVRGNREQELRNKLDICVDALKDIAFGGVREISDENLRLTNIAINALEQIDNKERNDGQTE